MPSYKRKRITIYANPISELGKVLNYVDDQESLNFKKEIEELLIARFGVVSLLSENQASDKQIKAFAQECIGILEGYIGAIKEQAELLTTPEVPPLQMVPQILPNLPRGQPQPQGDLTNGKASSSDSSSSDEIAKSMKEISKAF